MNLLENLDDFLIFQVSQIHPKEKSQLSTNRYFKKLAEKMCKLADEPKNWIFEFRENFPERLKTLDSQQKQSLIECVKELDFCEFAWFMQILCKMLTYLENHDELETEFGYTLMQNYAYLKTEVSPTIYPEQNKQFNKQIQRGKQEQANLPRCPKCGSTNLISNGLSWFCKSCGKQTRKNLV